MSASQQDGASGAATQNVSPESYEPPSMRGLDPAISQVTIGTTGKTYHVHRAMLIGASHFFAAALTGPFKEQKENTVTLHDIDGALWEECMEWLYGGDIVVVNLEFGEDGMRYTNVHELVKLYVLADRLEMPQLRNQIMDALDDTCDGAAAGREWSVFSPADVHYIYEHVPESSGICRLMVDTYTVGIGNAGAFETDLKTMPAAFMAQVTLQISRWAIVHAKTPLWGQISPETCRYHEHKDLLAEQQCGLNNASWSGRRRGLNSSKPE